MNKYRNFDVKSNQPINMKNTVVIALSSICLLGLGLLVNPSIAAPAFCTSTGSRCITASDSSCRDRADGDYQACEGCTFYHSCVAGVINYSFRDCAKTDIGGINGKLVWDDVLKRCEYRSTTCQQCNNGGGGQPDGSCTSTGSRCITASDSSCRDRADGDYQACEGCTFYHSCVAGVINYSFRDCARTDIGGINGKLVWDDVLKRCEYESNTCRQCHIGGGLPGNGGPVQPGQCTSTGSRCITASDSSCRDRADGDYQACEGCTFYHSCVAGVINYSFRDCARTDIGGINGKLVWDDVLKRCEYESNTCRQCHIGGGLPGNGGPVQPGQCTSTGSRCITASDSSCRDRADGDYQACEGCTFYHSCVAGVINYSFRDCARTDIGGINGKLVWDDVLKRCEYESNTCRQCHIGGGLPGNGGPVQPGQCTSTGSRCITASDSSCRDRADGDYQACEGCTFYHSCVAGVINYSFRDCARTDIGGINGKLVWDDVLKRCEYESNTCRQCHIGGGLPGNGGPVQPGQCTSTGSRCITAHDSSCRDRADGDYQACEGCTFYHSCVAGVINYSFRDCARTDIGGINGKLVWDDVLKRCEYESNTCRQCHIGGGLPGNGGPVQPGQCTSTGSRCITAHDSSCRDRADGDYQACEGCTFYHSCVAGVINYSFRDCARTDIGGINGKLVWDDVLKRCEYESNTCRQCHNGGNEVHEKCEDHKIRCLPETEDACRGQLDGDYQSCSSCHRYTSCKDGLTWTNRPCPVDSQGRAHSWVITGRTQGYCSDRSETCNNCPITDKCTTGKGCVEESETTCAYIADGDYQSCSSCHVYISCKDGKTWNRRPCPVDNNGNQQVWTITGPTQGHCTSQSATCNECPVSPKPLPPTNCLTTGTRCIHARSNACQTLDDGHYQACESCNIYHSCSGGVIWANRQCPPTYYGGRNGRLVWVQVTPTEGRCDYTSSTCHGQGCSILLDDEAELSQLEVFHSGRMLPSNVEHEQLAQAIGEMTSSCRTSSTCIDGTKGSCPDVNGDYQDCTRCDIFHSCSGGIVIPNRSCTVGLVWQANSPISGECAWRSSTCTECK